MGPMDWALAVILEEQEEMEDWGMADTIRDVPVRDSTRMVAMRVRMAECSPMEEVLREPIPS